MANVKRAFSIFMAVAALSTAGQRAAFADAMTDANAAYARQDYQTALKLWLPLAQQGNADAQDDLASLYFEGQGVSADPAKAKQWFEKSAAQGDADAQFNLAQMYQTGKGITQNYGKARDWFEQAANRGNAMAQDALGMMYVQGQGTHQDYIQAYLWISLATDSKDEAIRKTAKQDLDDLSMKMTPDQIMQGRKLVSARKMTAVPAETGAQSLNSPAATTSAANPNLNMSVPAALSTPTAKDSGSFSSSPVYKPVTYSEDSTVEVNGRPAK